MKATNILETEYLYTMSRRARITGVLLQPRSCPSFGSVRLAVWGWYCIFFWPNRSAACYSSVDAILLLRDAVLRTHGRGPAKSGLARDQAGQPTRVLSGVYSALAERRRSSFLSLSREMKLINSCCVPVKDGVTVSSSRPRLPTGRSQQSVGPDHEPTTRSRRWRWLSAQDHHL
jgi:hypothetical protein